MKNVSYGYSSGNDLVLNNITASFKKKKITALIGGNGSGKTTLLKNIIGILNPLKGKITIDGIDRKKMSSRQTARLIGWVPQKENIYFPFTVEEFILMGRTPHLGYFNIPSDIDKDKVKSIMKEMNLSSLSRRQIGKLSGGEERKIAIARTLAQEPKVLVLDEPTVHLDMGNRAKLLKKIENLSKQGRTIIFSTHDPNEASLIAHEVFALKKGKLLAKGKPGDVLKKSILLEIYDIPVVVELLGGRLHVGFESIS